MQRTAKEKRKTSETEVEISLCLDGSGIAQISTGIAFFDHMLTLFAVHGFFDLSVNAIGDLDVDFHHTVEDVGIVLGDAVDSALGDRRQIKRYGYAVTPMDDAMSAVALDLAKRPYLVYRVPGVPEAPGKFGLALAKEFFRALSIHSAMNVHIHVFYGENEHHMIESVFKSLGRALDEACTGEPRLPGVQSSKGIL
ncbi:MAG: imidazoleglycerol-phosphate dehydratase HisB [Desulfobacterales bacterium]